MFVLEDPKNNTVVGTSAIESSVGHDEPFYSYKLSKHTRVCHDLNIRNDYDVLSLVNDYQGHSELCTLFLDPRYRVNSNGVLLSRARFLFMAYHPLRFARTLIAEMRGVSDDQGNSPFWDQVGAHFFQMTFAEADRLTLSTNKQFISDLMPRQPIYVQLLTPEAQAVIGKPHQATAPAMNILLKEGFRYNDYIDIFDAGPTIEAPLNQIQTIVTSKNLTFKKSMDAIGGMRYLIANTKLNYRATIGQVLIDEEANSCAIHHDIAQLLELKIGDKLCISPL